MKSGYTSVKVPRVSIVTPSFNQGKFIEETIRSVISQTGNFHLEYLIMDGGSTDNTVEVIRKYEKLLREKKWPIRCAGIEFLWVSEGDRGQSDAVNKGFSRSKGEFLGWLNSDDTYIEGSVQKALDYFRAHPEMMMVYGEGYHVDEDGKIIERYYTEPFDYKRLAELCFICQPTVFLKRASVEEIGLLDESLDFCMDYDYWIRLAKKLKVGYAPEYFANSRLHADTKTMSKRKEAHKEIVQMVKHHYGYVPNNWLYAYTRLCVEGFMPMRGMAKPVFKLSWGLFFLFKCLQVNKRLPTIPLSDIRFLIKKKTL